MGLNGSELLGRFRRYREFPSACRNVTALSSKALTAVILNHARFGRLSKAVSILFDSFAPFHFSVYEHLFRICAWNRAIVEIRKLESSLVTFYPDPPVFLLNRAIESYGKCGCLEDAKELFDEMPRRNVGSWNAIITAFSRKLHPEDAILMFSRMIGDGVYAKEVTFASVLASCGDVLELWLSRQVHGHILKYGFVGNVILESSLVDVYGKCGAMHDARKMFDDIENPNAVSWNVIVRRYLEIGDGKEAVTMFSKMIRMKARPMNFTISNAIVACSSFGGLKEAIQIHGFAIKMDAVEDDVVSSTLIGMYAKCGDHESARRLFEMPCSKDLVAYTSLVSAYAMSGKISEAREIFDGMPERNVVSWNVMLAGYTRLGKWDKALDLVIQMRNRTQEINQYTLCLILKICAATPDVELGKQVHGYAYRHCFHSSLFVSNALLDMYGKCGTLNWTRRWFYEMSNFRNNVSWNALLMSFSRHGLSEATIMAFPKMLGETTPSRYTFATLLVACANIHALYMGKQIHAYMFRNGYDFDIVITGALVDMYSKCHCIAYAIRVFIASPSKDVVLFNSMIMGCAYNGMGEKVFKLFDCMEDEGITPDHVTFLGILRGCVSEGQIELGRKYFELMCSDEYQLMPWLEHYSLMIELYGLHGFMEELALLLKTMPFQPSEKSISKVVDFRIKRKRCQLGEWIVEIP